MTASRQRTTSQIDGGVPLSESTQAGVPIGPSLSGEGGLLSAIITASTESPAPRLHLLSREAVYKTRCVRPCLKSRRVSRPPRIHIRDTVDRVRSESGKPKLGAREPRCRCHAAAVRVAHFATIDPVNQKHQHDGHTVLAIENAYV